MRTTFASRTHIGHVRRVNEDRHLASPAVFVVADGMGGQDAGDLASQTVIEAFAALRGEGDVVHGVEVALQRAHDLVNAIPTSGHGAGSTVVAALTVPVGSREYWLLVNVGDSRAYRMSGGALRQVTVDHSVVQELLDAGAVTDREARRHPQRHVVTRAVGGDGTVDPEFWLVPVVPGERLLLCSDGLTTEVDDVGIARVLREETDPGSAADRLVEEALRRGGRDNVTVVVVDVEDAEDLSATTPRAVVT